MDPKHGERPPSQEPHDDQAGAKVKRRRDDTMVVPSPRASTAPSSAAVDEPPSELAMVASTKDPATSRERVVASGVTVDDILDELRKTPFTRIAPEGHIGAGGMGTIEVATDRALERRIAVKALHPHLRGSDLAVRMFLREARLTSLLDHPHIVPVYDIGERSDGELYFTMKLVEGRTLADLVRALPPGPLDTSALYAMLDVVTKVCDALAFAHSRGVIHCDVKPSNVMVGEFGQVYLMDWGIARLFGPSPGDATRPPHSGPTISGTPGYMSPEQAQGNTAALDARSDVFLIGALVYEILTRMPPYATSDRSSTLRLAANATFPLPRSLAGEGSVPQELERIVLRAMAKEKDDRYPTVAAFRDDLVRFMRGGAEFPRKTFTAGEAIVTEGEPGDAAYIIVTGRCEVRREHASGVELLGAMGPGDVFGEMAIMTEGPRTATVRATEPTTVLVVTSEALEQEMAALKPWMATLLKSLALRFREADTRTREGRASKPDT